MLFSLYKADYIFVNSILEKKSNGNGKIMKWQAYIHTHDKNTVHSLLTYENKMFYILILKNQGADTCIHLQDILEKTKRSLRYLLHNQLKP